MSVQTVNSTTLLISWFSPVESNGVIEGYYINYTLESNRPENDNIFSTDGFRIVPSDGDMLFIFGLHEFRQYNVTVQAFTSVGLGTFTTEFGTTSESGI